MSIFSDYHSCFVLTKSCAHDIGTALESVWDMKNIKTLV
jgi:hypothetical protein